MPLSGCFLEKGGYCEAEAAVRVSETGPGRSLHEGRTLRPRPGGLPSERSRFFYEILSLGETSLREILSRWGDVICKRTSPCEETSHFQP